MDLRDSTLSKPAIRLRFCYRIPWDWYIFPGIPITIKTMGANITTIVYLRVLIIQIGSTIVLIVVEAQGIYRKLLKFHRTMHTSTALHSLKLTVLTCQEAIPKDPKENNHLPTIHVQVLLLLVSGGFTLHITVL